MIRKNVTAKIISVTQTTQTTKTTENLTIEERFQKDFNDRFSGKMMVSNELKNQIYGFESRNICSREQINEWIKQWTAANKPIERNFIQNVNTFIALQFKTEL